ncbi:alpha/beta hydrolase [soil metagenome]
MIVYKQYNQQHLNNQYNNRLHVPDFATYYERWEKRNAAIRAKHAFIKDLAYGAHPGETLDLFPSGTANAKVLVFIHGGYWQMLDKATFHFVAEAFLRHNITTVLINYPHAPGATMDEMVASCRNAMLWLQQNLAAFNADPQQVYVAGHSAGAHLASMLMEKEWAKSIQNPIKGICVISGLFDLHPIQLSYVNEALQMNKEMAIRNSPIDLVPAQDCPVLVAAGAAETAEFQDQSRKFYNNWKNKKASVELMELHGLNHFSILDSLVDENALLHKAIVKLMGLQKPDFHFQ